MNFNKAESNKIKLQYFKDVKNTAKKSADLNIVSKILDECDDKLLHLRIISVPGHIETLSDKFTDVVYSAVDKTPVKGADFNQFNKNLSKSKRSRIILDFINNNK